MSYTPEIGDLFFAHTHRENLYLMECVESKLDSESRYLVVRLIVRRDKIITPCDPGDHFDKQSVKRVVKASKLALALFGD